MIRSMFGPALILAICATWVLSVPVLALSDTRSAKNTGAWQDLKQTTQKKIEQLDEQLNKLDEKIQSGNEKAKAEIRKIRQNVTATQKDIARKIDEVGDRSRESWQSVKAEIDIAVKKLEDSYNRLKEDLTR